MNKNTYIKPIFVLGNEGQIFYLIIFLVLQIALKITL